MFNSNPHRQSGSRIVATFQLPSLSQSPSKNINSQANNTIDEVDFPEGYERSTNKDA